MSQTTVSHGRSEIDKKTGRLQRVCSGIAGHISVRNKGRSKRKFIGLFTSDAWLRLCTGEIATPLAPSSQGRNIFGKPSSASLAGPRRINELEEVQVPSH